MILCVGEILADLIGSEREGVFAYERKAGGAPFNVACGIQKFGGKAYFVGSVGEDLIGEFLVEFAKNMFLCGMRIDKLSNRNTTLAFVQLGESGERSFCFYRKNTADYILGNVDDELLKKASIINIGSLMLSEEVGAEYAIKLANRARSLGVKVAFDVNFRTDIFKDEESAKEKYKKILVLADIVKFSEDEVAIFGEEYISNNLCDKLICISLGCNGSEWRFNNKKNKVATIKVNPIDTTGAGDAFFAGVLKGLDETNKSEWSEEFLNRVFSEGNVCGALNTLGKGAIDFLPDRQSIENALKKI